MSSDHLEQLVKAEQLTADAPDRKEFEGLVRSGRTRLIDARRRDLALESRFDLAYNATRALSLAALRRQGYRSEDRLVVFQCLPHTINLAPEHWRVLALANDRWDAAESSGDLQVDEQLLAGLLRIAELVLAKLTEIGPPK